TAAPMASWTSSVLMLAHGWRITTCAAVRSCRLFRARMGRWTADSDLDYWDEMDAQPTRVTMTCRDCGAAFDQLVSEVPAYWPRCVKCWRRAEARVASRSTSCRWVRRGWRCRHVTAA